MNSSKAMTQAMLRGYPGVAKWSTYTFYTFYTPKPIF